MSNTSYKRDDSPNTWEDDGKIEGPITHHSGLCDYDTANVRDSHGDLHENVTVIDPNK
jgi:hypothetical protein